MARAGGAPLDPDTVEPIGNDVGEMGYAGKGAGKFVVSGGDAAGSRLPDPTHRLVRLGFVAAGDDDTGNRFGSRGLGGNRPIPCLRGLDHIS